MKNLVFLLLCLHLSAIAYSQSGGTYLDLSDTGSVKNMNLFSFEVDAYSELKLKEISGEKLELPVTEITCKGVPLKAKSVKTRGQSTLYFERKSFSISLEDPVIMGERKIKKLALNNLAMDHHYYRNRLSFILMDMIGIFPLQNEYANLLINGNPAGLYLAIQKPEDYTRSLESRLLVRREYEGHYTIEDANGDDTRSRMKRLRSIPRLSKRLEGQHLYDSLNSIVHMEHYFQWLAFNYLIKNGDYTDELFLYLTGSGTRFDIIPWDYDDIFMNQPHDGIQNRNKVLDHKLIFSGEAYLDIVIDKDKFLYLEFLNSFRQVLEILNPDVLKYAFEEAYRELYPYYNKHEVIGQSEHDYFGPTDLQTFKTDLRHQFQDILIRRKGIEVIIASELIRLNEKEL